MAPTSAFVTPSTLAKETTLKDGYIIDERDKAKVAHNEFSDDIPVISLAGIDEEHPGGRREAILKKVVEACEEWGIFQLVDHGIDVELINEMTKYTKEFFALPDEEKLKYEMSPGKHKGGFLISSHLTGEAVANWRELVLFFTYPVQGRDYSRWPSKPEQWKAMVEAYGENMMNLSCKMFELLSEGLGLDKDAYAKSMGDISQHLVVNHYPKCPQPELAVGLKRHTDPSSITLLLQDHVGGLQATKDGGKTWVTVRPIKNALVLNLGDHAYFMSNGRFKSADHQAIVNSIETRTSIAVFMNPAQDAKVYPLNVKEGEKAVLEEPITYAEMNNRHKNRYLEIVRLKKLAKEENWSQEELDLKLSQLN
ncbi:naringenin,2-oxoglutarate 3-dioxygenase-like [Chenopodium quinoa]|uniref:Fe2OG dioxygenase domain-containing protein n=1 Tax=Chenopodium quinoa TaxID=63459 RepID=A0A803N804_CHEQI|nr:naringenin,2-oxoglutarate 3-dioxygenase-like [Chenopodium quinoa]